MTRREWRLQPTRHNFARVQAAAVLLDRALGTDQYHDTEAVVDAPNPLRGDLNAYFPFLNKAVADQTSGGKIAVLDFLPSDAESFERVFGRSWTAADQSKLRRARGLLNEQNPPFARSLLAALNDPHIPIVALIGHNRGGSLVGPDGKTLDLRRIGESCARHVKLCIFAVCESQEAVGDTAVGVSDRLSLVGGGRLVRDLIQISNSTQSNVFYMVHDMLERVDVNGSIIRYVGWRTNNWFAVHMIVILVRCPVGETC